MLKKNLALLIVLYSFFFTGLCIYNATYSGTMNNPYAGQFKTTNQWITFPVDPKFDKLLPQCIGGIQLITGLYVANSKALKNHRFMCSYAFPASVTCNFQTDIETAWTSLDYRVYIIATDSTQNQNLQIGFIPSQRIDPPLYQTQAFSIPWMGTVQPSANYVYYPMIASVQETRKGSQPLEVQLVNPHFDPITGLATYEILSNAQFPFRIQINYVVAALTVPSFPTLQGEAISTSNPKPQAVGPLGIKFRPTTKIFNTTNKVIYYEAFAASGLQLTQDPISPMVDYAYWRHLQVQRQCNGVQRSFLEYNFKIQFDDNTVAEMSKAEYLTIAAAYDYSQGHTEGLALKAETPGIYQSSSIAQDYTESDLANIAGQLSEKDKAVVLQMIKKGKFVVTVNSQVKKKCVQCDQNEVFVLSIGDCKPKTTTLREIMYPLLEDKNYITLDDPIICLKQNTDRMTELANDHWLLSVQITADEIASCKPTKA